MELQKDNVIKAYLEGNDVIRKMLQNLYPDINFTNLEEVRLDNEIRLDNIARRVRTVEDACEILGARDFVVQSMSAIEKHCANRSDILAYAKLRVICKALNMLWIKASKEDIAGRQYTPVFTCYCKDDLSVPTRLIVDAKNVNIEFVVVIQEVTADQRYCLGLGLYSRELAEYVALQFTDLLFDFHLMAEYTLKKIKRL